MPRVYFIPNDPMAVDGPPKRRIAPPPYPSGNVARCDVRPAASPGLYDVHTAEFDCWQTRAALIRGLKTWRLIDRRYLRRWYGNRTALPVYTNRGDDLNAFYDRRSLQFFAHTYQGRTVHSCESLDIAVHEQGHAFLDAIRPDLWDANFTEAGAFHEAFADIMSILTALTDPSTRRSALAASARLDSHQFVERLGEELGAAIRREYGTDYAEPGALRRALNTFRWAHPSSLPANAPVSRLSRQVHNFSRVFSGSFYDLISNIFAAGPQTSAGLRRAAITAGKLLVAATRTVPVSLRLFEGVGQRMLMADTAANGGANIVHVRAAFEAHGMTLGAPVASLPVPLARRGTMAAVTASLRTDMGVRAGTRLVLTPTESEMHGDITHVAAKRSMRLTGPGLSGLHIQVLSTARVQMRGRSVVGLLGDPVAADDEAESEARAFAQALAASGDISGPAPRSRRGGVASRRRAAARAAEKPSATHKVVRVGGLPTIIRRGFA